MDSVQALHYNFNKHDNLLARDLLDRDHCYQ